MKGRGGGLLALLFLALAGVLAVPFAGGRKTEETPEAAAARRLALTPAPPAVPAESAPEVAAPLLTWFLPPADRVEPRTLKGVLEKLDEAAIPVSALVVTVPDPVDSILDYAFDRTLDAVQRAVRVNGYLLDRYSLPWLDRVAGRSAPDADRRGPRERPPGVLLFRRVHSPRSRGGDLDARLLVVYLVAETPISGIQRTPLTLALGEARTIAEHAAGGEADPPRIALLGPFFSGSAFSLRYTLQSWARAAGGATVTIVSGSATRDSNRELLTFEDEVTRLVATFTATVAPDGITKRRLYGYLKDLGVDFGRVALLTESNTAYGLAPESSSPEMPSEDAPEPGVSITFPMHISQLRAAYARDKLLEPFGDATGTAQGTRTLDLPLGEAGRRRDAVPSVSELSSASDELSLAAILATLSRLRIQYVGLMATDVRDKLFLARQIALNCPGVTLFTLDSDILLAHPKYIPYLRGMLVASTYPLYNRNQVWTPDATPRDSFQFPSGGAEGVFNATLVLLGRDDALVEYGPPFPQLVSESAEARVRNRPPVWLSVVGNSAVWPLAVLPNEVDENAYLYVRTRAPAAGTLAGVLERADQRLTTSRLSHLFLWALSLLSVGLSLAFAVANRREEPPPEESAPLRPDLLRKEARLPASPTLAKLRLDAEKRVPYRKDLLLLLLFTPLFLVQLLASSTFLTPYRLALREGPAAFSALPAGSLADLAGVLLSLLVLTLTMARVLALSVGRQRRLLKREIRRLRRHPLHRSELRSLLGRRSDRFLLARIRSAFEALSGGVLTLLLFVTIGVTVWYAWPPDLLPALLLFERLTNPASGLSILVPVVLLSCACALLAFCHLRRLTLDEWGGFGAALVGRRSSDLEGAEALERQILRTFRQIWVSPVLSAFGTIVFGFLVVWLLARLSPAPESEPYQTLFRIIFFFACLVTLFTAARYALLWQRLQTFLRFLAAHPMADAFDRVPRRLAEAVGPRAFGRFISLPDFARLLHQWRLLEVDLKAARPGLHRDLGLKESDTTRVLDALANLRTLRVFFSGRMRRSGGGILQTWKARAQTAGWVGFLARVLQPIVEPYWRTKPLPADTPAGGKDASARPAESSVEKRALDPAAAAWLRQAEEFIASHLVIYVAYVFLHLRNLLSAFLVSALLLFVAITAYPFQPARILVFFLIAFIVLLAALAVGSFLQMDRDEILSRVARTQAGKVSWDLSLVLRIVLYGLLPILSVLATRVPEVQTGFSSLIEGLSRAIK
ncbi:MAG: hypothetical protein ACM3JH_04435 [Acidithiobacillales bacterium]